MYREKMTFYGIFHSFKLRKIFLQYIEAYYNVVGAIYLFLINPEQLGGKIKAI